MTLAAKHSNPLRAFDLGLGTWQWGDQFLWQYGRGYGAADIRGAYTAARAAGLAFFDTAEVYGLGRSERYLGAFINADAGPPPFLATKFFPFPWRWTKGDLRAALRASLRRLGRPAVDLYQMHWPFPPVAIETWMDALADAAAADLVRAVGVSNYDTAQTRRAYTALKARGLPLASNQVRYSLLDRGIEHSGLLALCQELDVRVIAYSPLAQGLLTGKYSAANPPPGLRGRMARARLRQCEPLLAGLRAIGATRGGKTPAQVALNWCICKGTMPIPGAKTAAQAEQNAGALGWRLTRAEVAQLDQLSDQVPAAS